MSKQFDDKLSSRIKDVFGSHIEEYNPDHWQKMKEKLGTKPGKKLIYLFPFMAKAASVILFLGLSVFLLNRSFQGNNTRDFGHNHVMITDTSDSPVETLTDHNSVVEEQIIRPEISRLTAVRQKAAIPEQVEEKLPKHAKIEYIAGKEDLFAKDSSKFLYADIKNHLKKHRDKIQQKDSIGSGKVKPDLYDYKDDLILAETDTKKQKKLEFGFGLATVSNYSADASGSSLNMGGGFSADYRIAKNLSISSGMMIAKNELGYHSTSGTVYENLKQADYAADNSIYMVDGSSAETDLSFVAIDVPVNLKYRYKKMSFSAGISSLILVNEKYSYTYDALVTNTQYNLSTDRYETNSTVQNFTSEETAGNFNHFDFAELLNVSVAYDVQLTKGSIAVEPYVKIPLSNITSRDVKMGSGGVMVRYIF